MPDTDTKRSVTLVIHEVHQVGGMERQIIELITGYLARGWKVILISRSCELDPHPRLIWHRIPIMERPFVLKFPLFWLLAGLAIWRHREGLLHVNGALVPNRADLSTIHFCHRAFEQRGLRRVGRRRTLAYRLNQAIGRIYNLAAESYCLRPRHIPAIVGISNGVSVEARDTLGYPGGAVHTIPYGVDSDRYRPDAIARHNVRRELGIAEDDLLLLFVGGEWDRKGLGAVVDAVAATPPWRLCVVGVGDVGQYARRAGAAADRLHFAGLRRDPERFYAAADAFCLPTSYETFCLVAHEAAAAGLPLLVGRVSGVEDLIVEGQSGWFVDADPLQISNRLAVLAADPELRRRLGATARLAVTSMTWRGAVDAHITLYEALSDLHRAEDYPATS
jgi:glycosyltransferase involved in cell wall biosynthesis